MLIGAVFFVDFYTREGSASWARVLKDALGDVGLSLTAPSLRGFFSPRLVLQGISWPSSLSIRSQVILGISIFLLAGEYAQAAFRVVYYKLKHGKWASPIKPLSQRVKKLAALVTERCILFVAPLYERFRDGTGATDEDLKAWAKNNPRATKIDLKGLTSVTGGGIAEVIEMLPLVSAYNLSYGPCIGDEGASAIATALPDSKVTELKLFSNNIGDEAKAALKAAAEAKGCELKI